MAAKEPENSEQVFVDETLIGMTQIHSEKFGFTVWFQTSENKQLCKVVVISNASGRLELLENHLKSINYHDEGTVGQTLIEEAEKIFEKINQNKDLQENKNAITACKYFLKGTCRFGEQCFNSHDITMDDNNGIVLHELPQNAQGIDNNNNADHHLQSKTHKKKMFCNTNLSKKPVKKTPMKTATDVINRIQWDKQLNPEDFTVGYLDRFLGIVENTYSSFDWEDVTSMDETILAIPRHRIQYFKYHDQIVWDKRKRLDCVFGSTGSGQTILDIIEKNNQENTVELN